MQKSRVQFNKKDFLNWDLIQRTGSGEIIRLFQDTKRKITSKAKRNAYLPLSWDDDYCQIEIVPAENRESIEKRITEVKILADQSREGLGFTEIFQVGQMSITTFSKEILTEPLSHTKSPSQMIEQLLFSRKIAIFE